MTDTFGDDGWDELTRELGVEKSPPANEPAENEPAEEDPALSQEFAEPTSEVEEFDAGLEPEGDAPDGAEAPGDDQPGTGKKRRRRRRRRGKKGSEEEGADEAAPSTVAAPAEAEPEYGESEYETGPGSDNDSLVPMPVGVDEDTAGEALRDLIANWNVPSWDSIITGLNRPER